MASGETKTRILAAAQEEFATSGYHGTSIRTIAAKAGVKLGAIRYHFGSKDDLFEAVIRSHITEVLDSRHNLEKEQDTREQPLNLEAVVTSFLGPVLDIRESHPNGASFAQLIAATVSDPADPAAQIVKKLFDPTAPEIFTRLRQAAPHLKGPELYWGFFLGIGALAMACRNGDRLTRLSKGLAKPDDAC